ncbi:MAG: hypothetical protein Q8R02_10770 [Hyphomonadaceae bacterium]|nr:hypothetical protein [Hyphomonadaceae bacterium]
MSTVTGVITRSKGATAAIKPGRSQTFLAGRAMLWAMVMVIGGATLVPIGSFTVREFETFALVQANETSIQNALGRRWPASTPAPWLETLSELGLQLEKPAIESSLEAARQSVATDPSRASAWAKLAYLEYVKAGKVTPAALGALSKSMEACPFCDRALIRWRFNFVLANWAAMPEALRLRAFEQADVLRWTGENTEFLAEMKTTAVQAGIPFGALQSAVNTPWRSWDLETPPETPRTETEGAGR